MIPILFKEDETNFDSYGIGILKDCISCATTEELNGQYECTFTYPALGNHYKYIKVGNIIKLKSNDGLPQLFRVYKINTDDSDVSTIYAAHISYDLSGIGCLPFSEENMSISLILNRIIDSSTSFHEFSISTNLTNIISYSSDNPLSVRHCIYEVLKTSGGEIVWDNFHIRLLNRRGIESDVVIQYGKNLTGFSVDKSDETIYSHLLPYAKDKEKNLVLTEIISISPTEAKTVKTLIRDFTSEFSEEETITSESLKIKANQYLLENHIGISIPNITFSFEMLADKYGFNPLFERISLGDTVSIQHTDYSIDIKSKVIKTEYDGLLEKYTKVTLGKTSDSLIDNIKDMEIKLESADKELKTMPSLMQKEILKVNELITGQSGGYVVLNTDKNHIPYEILIMDSPEIETAINIWRWNNSGLAHSSNGYSGPYNTAITSDGSIVADCVNTGVLNANFLRAGVISSADGSSYWDLETGDLVLGAFNKEIEDLINKSFEELKKYSFRLGNFAFYPQVNGSLSFNKVGE